MALQIRRGTDTQRQALSGVNTPIAGELLYTTDNKKLHIGDGTTTGGTSIGYFGSVAVSGQSTIKSTGANEALTIVAGANISLATDANTGTLTIAAAPQELNNGNLRLFQNNISSINSNEDINIDPAGTGKVNVVGNLTATTLTGALTGNVTGNADSATVSSTVDITNTNGLTTVYYPTFVENRTTGQTVRADVDLTYRTDTNTLTAPAFSGNLTGNVTGNVTGSAGSVTNGIYTTDTGTVTNTMLAGSIANAKLANSSLTVGTTAISLGSTVTNITGLASVTTTTLSTVNLNLTGAFNNQRIKINENIIEGLTSNENVEVSPAGTGTLLVRSNVLAEGAVFGLNPTVPGISIFNSTANKSSLVSFQASNSASLSPTFVTGTLTSSANTVTGAPFTFVRSRGNPLAPTASVSGDEITTFDFLGFDGANGFSANKIRSIVDGAVSTGIVPGKLEFLTTNSAGTQAVTLTVSSTAVTSAVPVKLAVYADATARNAAITSPTAGMIVLTDTTFQGYNGSAWVNFN